MTLAAKGSAVLGAIRFMNGYYLILVTKRRRVGTLCGHAVYTVAETETVELPHPSVLREASADEAYDERRYCRALESMDLTRDFFFSYTYPLTASLQANVAAAEAGRAGAPPLESAFCWNAFLAEPVAAALGGGSDGPVARWLVAAVHGFFRQTSLAVGGVGCSLSLLARRSRHFAGTRYLKRGVNDAGRVANEVETEQILDAGRACGHGPPRAAAVVQLRGSVPLFWSQEPSTLSPKPDVLLQRFDPFYAATRAHFDSLAARYGHPVVVLSLIKAQEKRPREMILRRELAAAVEALNAAAPGAFPGRRVVHCHWDFAAAAKQHGSGVLAELQVRTPLL